MASWFTKALDRLTPWDRGGELQRRREEEERRRREAAASRPAPAPRQQAPQPQAVQSQPNIRVQQPQNAFGTLNVGNNSGTSIQQAQPLNRVPVTKNYDTVVSSQPKPGEVIQPVKGQVSKEAVDNAYNAIVSGQSGAPRSPLAIKGAQVRLKQEEEQRQREKKDRIAKQGVVRKVRNTIASPFMGMARLGASNAQFFGGAYDLLTPGKGQNRLSKFGNRHAERIDEIVDNNDLNTKLYRGTQIGGELLTGGGTSQIGKQIVKQSPRLTRYSRNADRMIDRIPGNNKVSRATRATAKEVVSPEAIVAESYFANKAISEDAARGNEITPQRAALEYLMAIPSAVGSVGVNKIIQNLTRRRTPTPSGLDGLDDAAIGASADATIEALTPRPVTVTKNIPVQTPESMPQPVRVRDVSKPKPIIREVTGDQNLTTTKDQIQEAVEKAVENRRQQAADNIPKGRPDPRIEGVTPRYRGDAELLTRKEIDAERAALDEALANKEINKTQYKLANKELDELEPVENSPKGKRIEVKKPESVEVVDKTEVPKDLPEAPGKVRLTTKADPQAAKTQAAASAPAAVAPAPLPKVGSTLPDGRIVTKRMLKGMRKQRSNAKAYAKTQEETNQILQQIEEGRPQARTGSEDEFAPTGNFRTGRKGNTYEKATRQTEKQLGQKEMATRSAEDLAAELGSQKTISKGDQRRIAAAKENLLKADPENARNSDLYRLLDRAEKAQRTSVAQMLALIPRTIRKSASSDELTGRWDRRLGNVLDDPAKLTDEQWQRVQNANDAYTSARDKAAALEEQFRKTGSEADFKAWEQAHKAAHDADTAAKMAEVKVAQEVLRGEKGAHVTKFIDDLKKEADVNTMDYVTANMLSGTATGFRNTFGTELAGIENRIGANLRAKVVKGLFGENVGGYERSGARYGRKYGANKWVGDIKRRGENGGKNPLEWGKNWATAINSGGESSMQSQVYSRLAKYYKNQFEAQGITGKDLDLRMRHAMVTDPDNMADVYLDATMKASGLTGMFEKGQTIEKAIVDYIGRHTDSRIAQGASKLLMRMLVGFPTATTNFMYQSGKRVLAPTVVANPSFWEAGIKLSRGDRMGAAMAFDRGLKEAGSGAAILGLGVMLGSQDMISGPYPEDKDERERWAREGISENSIKIGDAWYPIPQGAGMLGLPLLTGASIGRDGGEGLSEMYNPKNLSKLLPTDQLYNSLATLSGDGSESDLKNLIASSVRAVTPVGALFNQIAKSFDSTKNDTTTKDFWANVMDSIASGIPGVNNAANIPDKTDAEGNVIKNPNALQLALGATSTTQSGGEQRTAEINQSINSSVQKIDEYGGFSDGIRNILDKEQQVLFDKAKNGEQLDESDIKTLQSDIIKGVKQDADTHFLEKEDYDNNLAVLKVKRDVLAADPTTTKATLEDYDTQIKRGEIYKKNQTPYTLVKDYREIGVEDWRKMGIAPGEKGYDEDMYDPELYQALWELDQEMTEAGVSRGKKGKAKYYLKESKSGSGSGGGSSRTMGTDFGTLKASGNYAPKVQEYETIQRQTANVPIVKRVRPNIVHKISKSG